MNYKKVICDITDNYVYAFFKNSTIIKYNLLNKQTYVVFKSKYEILQYYISKANIYVCMYGDIYVYWNYVPFNKFSSHGIIELIKVKDGYWLVSYLNDMMVNFRGQYRKINVPEYIASLDARKIVYIWEYKLYIQKTSHIAVDDLFVGHKSSFIKNIDEYVYRVFFWISNSDYIIIGDVIMDLNSFSEIEIITSINYAAYVFLINEMIIILYRNFVEIYDTRKMVFVQRIYNDLIFTNYNQLLNVLVTDRRECFRLENDDSKYFFQKVILGINYILDYNIVSQNIKIIMETLQTTILYEISDDILFVELYQELLIYFC